jgi:RNA-binding protein
MTPLPNSELRKLKARAQLMDPTLKVGKDGLSPGFLAALDHALEHKHLVKVKFDFFKDEKKTLAPQMAEFSGSQMVMRVGNVVVLYRPPASESAAGNPS